ncbi:MAG TPA: MFS transporter [Bacteroidales bacterium]|nr:MFS transporter [Bacteroidales bacterium]
MKPSQKYSTLFSLYIAQSVPLSFFSTVLPVIMRMEHFSLTSIGLIQLIKLPWIIKFIWAPLIDKNASSHRHYKKWIIGSEIFYAACIIAIAFFNLKTDFITIIVLMVLAIIFSATQDIASDALAIRILKKEERPFGNSIQSMGNFGGTLLGSGCLLILYTMTGWSWLMILLAAFVLIALLPLIINVQRKDEPISAPSSTGIRLTDIFTFFGVPGILKWMLILALYYSGILGILSQLKPWMVDLGYNLKEIAFMVGIYGTGCGALGAFLAGFIVKYLGHRKSLLLFSAYGVLAALFFVFIAHTTITKPLLYTAITLLWSAYSMASVIIYTVSMGKVRNGKEGTDYSIQIVITHLEGILIAVLAGRIADVFGMSNLFICEAVLGMLVFVIVFFTPSATLDIRDYLTKKNQISNEGK